MKRLILTLSVLTLVTQISCKKTDTIEEEIKTEEKVIVTESKTEAPEANAPAEANGPKTYTITATPETTLLGKNSQASLKILNVKALELSDPDGKITGTELSYQVEVTNKNAIKSGGNVYINFHDFRLELDNGNKISHTRASSCKIAEEETKMCDVLTFRLPADTKPKNLHMFLEETRAIVALKME